MPYADCYHCPFGQTVSHCQLECVQFARETIQHHQAENLAAIVVEPVQGTNGNIVPPSSFLPALRQLARETGALLIVDEMITGFGRTGKFFASSDPGIDPDIIVVGKGMANGVPTSALLSNEEISMALPFAEPSGSSSSFGGNPLSAAAALATLRIIQEERLDEHAHLVGTWFLQELQLFEDYYPFVGKVQGQGLMIGIELVRDKATKEPLERHITEDIFHRLLKAGVLMMAYGPKIRINPPLCISKELCEQGLTKMREVFDAIAHDYFS